MKKMLKYFMFFSIMLTPLFLTSCGKDDDDGGYKGSSSDNDWRKGGAIDEVNQPSTLNYSDKSIL